MVYHLILPCSAHGFRNVPSFHLCVLKSSLTSKPQIQCHLFWQSPQPFFEPQESSICTTCIKHSPFQGGFCLISVSRFNFFVGRICVFIYLYILSSADYTKMCQVNELTHRSDTQPKHSCLSSLFNAD